MIDWATERFESVIIIALRSSLNLTAIEILREGAVFVVDVVERGRSRFADTLVVTMSKATKLRATLNDRFILQYSKLITKCMYYLQNRSSIFDADKA